MVSLRAARVRAGLNQDELAARAGVHVDTIRGIEAGRITSPRPHTRRQIADALGLPIAEIRELANGGDDDGSDEPA